jgi:hypothetical protein
VVIIINVKIDLLFADWQKDSFDKNGPYSVAQISKQFNSFV